MVGGEGATAAADAAESGDGTTVEQWQRVQPQRRRLRPLAPPAVQLATRLQRWRIQLQLQQLASQLQWRWRWKTQPEPASQWKWMQQPQQLAARQQWWRMLLLQLAARQ